MACGSCQERKLAGLAGVSDDEAQQFLTSIGNLALMNLRARQFAKYLETNADELRRMGLPATPPPELLDAIREGKAELMALVRIACGTEVPTDVTFILPRSVWPHDTGTTVGDVSFFGEGFAQKQKQPCVKVVDDSAFEAALAKANKNPSGFTLQGLPGGPLAALGIEPFTLIVIGVIVIVAAISVPILADTLTKADVIRAEAAKEYSQATAKVMNAVAEGTLDPDKAAALIGQAAELAKESGVGGKKGFWAQLADNLTWIVGGVVVVGGLGAAAYFLWPRVAGKLVGGGRPAPAVAGLSAGRRAHQRALPANFDFEFDA